jgi:two-component system, NarL family, invasion response regulator UvrY
MSKPACSAVSSEGERASSEHPFAPAVTFDRENYRILIVDDNALFRSVVSDLLAPEAGVTVVGFAGSGNEALKESERLRPDLVLMDLAMPGMSGLEATRRLTEMHAIPIFIITGYEQKEYREAAKTAGAVGYLLKWEIDEALIDRVRELRSRERPSTKGACQS